MSKFTFFWESESPFSNWHPSVFTHDGVTFNCSEQYMMYHKAMLFKDTEVAQLVLETPSPRAQKMLGREVRGFDEQVWKEQRIEIMVDGLVSKFEQNPALWAALDATGDTCLVEASPYDKVWGIGMKENDPRATDPTQWQGLNLLGEVLNQTREVIREKLSKS